MLPFSSLLLLVSERKYSEDFMKSLILAIVFPGRFLHALSIIKVIVLGYFAHSLAKFSTLMNLYDKDKDKDLSSDGSSMLDGITRHDSLSG
jgi:hypothetical protein